MTYPPLRPNPIEFNADNQTTHGFRAFFLFGDGRGNSDHALDGAVYADGEHLIGTAEAATYVVFTTADLRRLADQIDAVVAGTHPNIKPMNRAKHTRESTQAHD